VGAEHLVVGRLCIAGTRARLVTRERERQGTEQDDAEKGRDRGE
jgi:hypothetical protein